MTPRVDNWTITFEGDGDAMRVTSPGWMAAQDATPDMVQQYMTAHGFNHIDTVTADGVTKYVYSHPDYTLTASDKDISA